MRLPQPVRDPHHHGVDALVAAAAPLDAIAGSCFSDAA
jgi:hypothetical protein